MHLDTQTEVQRILDDVLSLRGRAMGFDAATPLLGAIAAVENQGRQKDIKVFGWDLTAKAISGIDGGYVTAVLQQDPEKMGAEALNALNSITSGKTVPKTILVPATVVTKANVDSYRPLFK